MSTAEDLLDAAVLQCLQRPARLRVTVRVTVPGLPGGWHEPSRVEWIGALGTGGERCWLESDGERVILAGPQTYTRLEDGRWTLSEGEEFSWGALHPRGLLEAVMAARTDARDLEDGRWELELDSAVLGRLMADGLYAGWRARAEVMLAPDGAVTSVSRILTDPTRAEHYMVTTFAFAWLDSAPEIQLPPVARTITLAEHVDELFSGLADGLPDA